MRTVLSILRKTQNNLLKDMTPSYCVSSGTELFVNVITTFVNDSIAATTIHSYFGTGVKPEEIIRFSHVYGFVANTNWQPTKSQRAIDMVNI